jgi:hypothetical protein
LSTVKLYEKIEEKETTGEDTLTSADLLNEIDMTLAAVTRDDRKLSDDAVRYIPLQQPSTGRLLAALFLPADSDEPVRMVDLPVDEDGGIFAAAYQLIECRLIQVIEPVDGVNYLCDEECSPEFTSDAVLNLRASHLAHALKFAQATGEYPPDNTGATQRERLQDALAWQAQVRLHGNVIVVGFDSGSYRPLPAPFLGFAREALDLDDR